MNTREILIKFSLTQNGKFTDHALTFADFEMLLFDRFQEANGTGHNNFR